MKYLYVALLIVFFTACNNDKSKTVAVQNPGGASDSTGTTNPIDPIDPIDNFLRSELLDNLTINIIIPAHENLQSNLNNLNNLVINFTNNQNQISLSELRKSYVRTYMAWQSVEMFNIGLAEEIDYNKTMNTYPCNTTTINNNIINQSYDFNVSSWPSWSSQGLPALDYLLYGLGDDSTSTLGFYTGNNGSNYLNYLNSIVAQMKMNTDLVTQDWQSEKESFISSDGNTATSSLNLLTNDFIYYYEKGLRAQKIGIPCGKWNSYQIYEIGVEAYYRKNISKRLALEALSACKEFFQGIGFNSGVAGTSYVDYLSSQGSIDVSEDILNDIDLAKISITSLDENFRAQLLSDKWSMVEAYDALQQVVVHLKVYMLISLQITVDYVDADGD